MTERAFLARLLAGAPTNGPHVTLGPGDDAALLRGPDGGQYVLTTDALVEGVHFERAWMPPAALARKALAVNLSDLAAMGASPVSILLSLIGAETDFPDSFGRAMREACAAYGVSLIGGNLSSSPGPVVVDITAVGEVAAGMLPMTRSGASDGDELWVSGRLGEARLGLLALQQEHEADVPLAVAAFREPRPQLALGAALARGELASAAMDLSDGLAADLPRLCEASGLSATVDVNLLPQPRESPSWAPDAKALAVAGGEDYGLLVAAAPSAARQLLDLGMQRIGRLTTGEAGVVYVSGDERFDAASGFDHF